jgi:hypothetical protein
MGLFGGKGPDLGGLVLDISAMGVRYASAEKVPLNTRLKMTITFRDAGELNCAGLVKWSHPHTQAGRFVIGVEFDALTEEQLAIFDKLFKLPKA